MGAERSGQPSAVLGAARRDVALARNVRSRAAARPMAGIRDVGRGERLRTVARRSADDRGGVRPRGERQHPAGIPQLVSSTASVHLRGVPVREDEVERRAFAAELAETLTREPRQIPSKYFYDELGSALFEAITKLPWYRITRAEIAM